jgi:hypothetical protein
MSNTLTVTEVVNSVTVTPVNNTVTVSGVGVQGPAGATGATGATGAAGSSGVVSVNAPITNTGTSSAANLSVSTGTTSAVGVLQLTDSVSSTSTTTAATPNAVKTAYDLTELKNLIIKLITGRYYKTPHASTSNLNINNQTAYYTPFYVPETTTLDRIAVLTGPTYSGTATVRLGIYNNTNGQPSTVVLDAGTITATASNTAYEITISQSLNTGFYWLVTCQQGTAPTVANYSGNAAGTNQSNAFIGFGSATPNGNIAAGFFQSSVTGAFASAGSLTVGNTIPYTYVRIA